MKLTPFVPISHDETLMSWAARLAAVHTGETLVPFLRDIGLHPDEMLTGGATPSETLPLRVYFQSLYDYATGWLGWTPAETWEASPVEIEVAFAAHVDRLIKMTPGASTESRTTAAASPAYTPERLREIEELGHNPAFDREGLRALKARQPCRRDGVATPHRPRARAQRSGHLRGC